MVFFNSQTVPVHESQCGLHSWIGYGMGLFQIGYSLFVLFFLKKIETFPDIAGIYCEGCLQKLLFHFMFAAQVFDMTGLLSVYLFQIRCPSATVFPVGFDGFVSVSSVNPVMQHF